MAPEDPQRAHQSTTQKGEAISATPWRPEGFQGSQDAALAAALLASW